MELYKHLLLFIMCVNVCKTAIGYSVVCGRDCYTRIDLFVSLQGSEDHLDSRKWYSM